MTTDSAPRMSTLQRRFVIFAFVLVVAFLGANPFADALGVELHDRAVVPAKPIFCGVLVGIGTLAALLVLQYLFRLVVASLARVQRKPPVWIAVTLIVSGLLCLLAALQLEWRIVNPSEDAISSLAVRADVASGSVSIRLQTPLTAQVIVACTFLAGVAMAAIGIWCSIPPATCEPDTETAKPPSTPRNG